VRGFLLINPCAGTVSGPEPDRLRAAGVGRGLEVHVLEPDEDATAIAREAQADVLGAAGGDGSVAAVAAAAVERGLPFVCVPYGTRNHFARDLGLGRVDPIGALAAFAGEEQQVDIGRAGERRFLNNVSFGIYALLVHRREHHRRRREAAAALHALLLGLRRQSEAWATLDGEPVRDRIVLVANNAYELRLFSLGARDRLDEGRLHVYSAEGWLPSAWSERSGPRFTIEAPSGRLEAAVDGEPAVLETPLELSIEPKTLRVLVPRAPG
jgi:diacylglycerol kinase family enzyme